MPDSRDRFTAASLRQAIDDRRAYVTRAQRLAAESETIEGARMPEGFVTLGTLDEARWNITFPRGNYTFTTTATATNPYTVWTTTNEGSAMPEPAPQDPTMWWGPCGMARCTCGGGMFYRDSRLTTPVPGTSERRGYCLTVKVGRSRIERYWQANSERRARAYQAQFFPNEKVLSVRRTRARRNGSRIETFIPEQCNVMVPGVTLVIEEDRIY